MSVESLEDERDGMRVEGKVGESDGDCIDGDFCGNRMQDALFVRMEICTLNDAR